MVAQSDREDPYLELVECWLKGGREREDAEREIFRQFSPQLKSFFQWQGYWPEEVEDLKQETFQRVFKNMEAFERSGRFYYWVLTIAKNIHRDRVRTDHGRSPRKSTDPLPCRSHDIPTTEPNPERIAIAKEKLNAVKSAMEQLPPRMRRCLELRVEGYEYEEIAIIMGIKVSTCRVNVHIARIRLRIILEEPFPSMFI